MLASKAREIGYPVLIKARAGGGGKGMRKVDNPDDFAEALGSARREAKSAFGDDRVWLKSISPNRAISKCRCWRQSRQCGASLRARLLAGTPPSKGHREALPGITAEVRSAMTNAAVKAAQAINYSGAGTIEFIVDATEGLKPDRFWFMEMNTRLQVEHPVTEMITGLRTWKSGNLRVAAGESCRYPKSKSSRWSCYRGASLCRRPGEKFPASHRHAAPSVVSNALQDGEVRVETGVRAGDTISPYYDPMIAKLVVHGVDRPSALAAMESALSQTEIAGTTTNAPFLSALIRHQGFAAGDVDIRADRPRSCRIDRSHRDAGRCEGTGHPFCQRSPETSCPR